ncbi:MAG: hypothetical protein ACE5EV_01895 [Gaiellales bacterium]
MSNAQAQAPSFALPDRDPHAIDRQMRALMPSALPGPQHWPPETPAAERVRFRVQLSAADRRSVPQRVRVVFPASHELQFASPIPHSVTEESGGTEWREPVLEVQEWTGAAKPAGIALASLRGCVTGSLPGVAVLQFLASGGAGADPLVAIALDATDAEGEAVALCVAEGSVAPDRPAAPDGDVSEGGLP